MTNTLKIVPVLGLPLLAGVVALGPVKAPPQPETQTQVPTTRYDFFMPGTQEHEIWDPMRGAEDCKMCHGDYDAELEPHRPTAASLMGQAARDPMWWAGMAIAEQDAAFAGEICLRCHTSAGWADGHSVPSNGSALVGIDFEGVSCDFCHRMVDPVYKPGISPVEDEVVFANWLSVPIVHEPHSAQFVLDPFERLRGPYNLGAPAGQHASLTSPYHRDAMMCVTCHDVSNPVFTRQPNGEYALNDLDRPHPTQNKKDMFPIERTAGEWLASAFAKGPIDMGGRFGGNKKLVGTCQDCHMPTATGSGAAGVPLRSDIAQHHFVGGNTWVLGAVRNLFPDSETFLSADSVTRSIIRTENLLRNASDMELSLVNSTLNVRVINESGHKIPTGYPEGRRIWVNVRFLDATGALVAERGVYDFETATLFGNDTKVYHAEMGVDAVVSGATGIPEGPSFHMAVSNKWYYDNRIPPRGFTNAGFEAVQAEPIAYSYADGQHWDDTVFAIPGGSLTAEVRIFYQSTSRKFVEFLRDENVTNDKGQIVYDQWVLLGKSAPVEIDAGVINLCYADCDLSTGAGVLDVFDFLCFQNSFVNNEPYACDCNTSTGPGVCDIFDFLCFQDAFVAGCP